MSFRLVLLLGFLALAAAQNNCRDYSPSCANSVADCYSSNTDDLAWIRKLCPKTCGVCYSQSNNENAGNGNCQDSGEIDCKVNDFCNNPVVTYAQREMYCRKSCNLC